MIGLKIAKHWSDTSMRHTQPARAYARPARSQA